MLLSTLGVSASPEACGGLHQRNLTQQCAARSAVVAAIVDDTATLAWLLLFLIFLLDDDEASPAPHQSRD